MVTRVRRQFDGYYVEHVTPTDAWQVLGPYRWRLSAAIAARWLRISRRQFDKRDYETPAPPANLWPPLLWPLSSGPVMKIRLEATVTAYFDVEVAASELTEAKRAAIELPDLDPIARARVLNEARIGFVEIRVMGQGADEPVRLVPAIES